MSTLAENQATYALVMAGGAGTRFWPMSRRARPKQLLPLLGGRSLLAATLDRLQPLLPMERILVATSAQVAGAVRRELPDLPEGNILAEPTGRDTAACIGWAAWRLARSNPEATMLVLPADHVIPDAVALCGALRCAAETAETRGGLVTLGLKPTRPETGFGYLELGPETGDVAGMQVHQVLAFIEKPPLELAEELLARGRFYWNSGMFAWRVATIVAEIRTHLPQLAAGLDELEAATAREGEEAALARVYPGLERVSIDFGVMERSARVWAVPVHFRWSDVGSWPGLAEVLPTSAAGVTVGDVVTLDCEDSVLVSEGPLVAAIGVRDLVVVATRDAVLVVPRSETQRVKELVAMLEKAGHPELL
jgi:mannose-1-phosphate guanylyltransferase